MKLHIGCGKVILPGWTNLDIEAGPGVDIVDDARTLESIERESCDIIYASHILDHFGRHEVPNVLACWHSRLRPGGILRLAVSDFAQVVSEYTNHHDLGALLGHIVGGHKSPYDRHGIVFDHTLLERMLTAAGFGNVERWDWREVDHGQYDDFSQAYVPHMAKTTGRLMSLNVQARKVAVAGQERPTSIGRAFYLAQIAKHGLTPASSVPDQFIREREESAILHALECISATQPPGVLHILDAGCGSGLLLAALHRTGYANVSAFDVLPEFVELARSRGLPYHIWQSDVREICGGFDDGKPIHACLADDQYDVVISQRVVINLLDPTDQQRAFAELRRVTKPGGYLVLVEAFADAWRELNAARVEFGLAPHPMAKHNRWLERAEFEQGTAGLERVTHIGDTALTPSNFLSSYFYAARVLHDVLRACLSSPPPIMRAGPFARFMGEVLPPVGNFANIQFYVFRKRGE